MLYCRRGEPDRQNAFIRERVSVCEYQKKAAAQLVFEGAVPSFSSCAVHMNSWTKEANDNDLTTTFIQGKKEAKGRRWKLTTVVEEPKGIATVDDDMFEEMSAECRKADAQVKSHARNRKC
jgi:hypothetical protein